MKNKIASLRKGFTTDRVIELDRFDRIYDPVASRRTAIRGLD